MISIMRNIRSVIGDNTKLLRQPIALAIIDAMLNMVFYSIMILTIVRLVSDRFTETFFYGGIAILVIVFVIRTLLARYSFRSLQTNGSVIATELRLQLAEHVRGLNSGYFNQNSVGRLTSYFSTDIADFEQVLTHHLTDFVKAIFGVCVCMLGALIIDFRFAGVLVVMIAVALPLMIKGGAVGHKIAPEHREKINAVISRVVEYINGIKTFRLYQLTGTKFKRLDRSFNELKKSSIRVELSMMPYVMIFSTIVSLMIPVALVWGTNLLVQGNSTPEQYVAVLMLSVSTSSQLMVIGMLYPELKYLAKSADNLRIIFETKPLAYTKEHFAAPEHTIAFENVSFSYENDVAVLKNVTFTVDNGKTTALVGPSGSGKSTVINLISRFWDVSEGTITIGGENVRDVRPDALTEEITCVMQDVYLFNDTILNNIRMAKPTASMEEVVEASRLANCHEFILQMEDGYDTLVGEGGSTLSGGEKQRISIARALLKDAPVVLLDESTSSLDADNEKEINLALDRLMKRKTVVVIAHRLNTIVNADQIIVLTDGEILEQGTHQDLCASEGWYARMIHEQRIARQWVVGEPLHSLEEAN
ncbi:ABC transporter [Enterococcus florum]|uniref:ABC transporter n=1 Tax=Enterococcus florum TaxID=2480627 RepID=A0A4P5PB84_9ENTE|nr:ABC transporter ATP-binding protein [Enterococcus florum]GCF95407.1 ABC transporter [Enterococcus florum]